MGGRLLENKDGSITLFGPGGVLYEGGRAAKLSVGIATSGSLVVSSTRNDSTSDITSAVVSGTLGGIVEARDVSATATLKQLDSLAADIATAFNGVHATGFGLDGVSGRNLFATTTTAAGMALDPILLDHPERLAMASTSGDLPGGNDTAVAMAALATASLGGAGTIAERFGQIANKVGAARSNADGDQKLREDTVSTATSLRESASGVSTDEEMVTLQQFQRGFEAASKVLKTVSDLFDTLMSLR